MDATNLKLDLTLFVSHVKNKSLRQDLPDDMLIKGIRERRAVTQDLWQVVRGHDFIDCFAFALRKTLASCPASTVTRERLEARFAAGIPRGRVLANAAVRGSSCLGSERRILQGVS